MMRISSVFLLVQCWIYRCPQAGIDSVSIPPSHPAFIDDDDDDDDILFQTKSLPVMWTALPLCRPAPPSRGPTPRPAT